MWEAFASFILPINWLNFSLLVSLLFGLRYMHPISILSFSANRTSAQTHSSNVAVSFMVHSVGLSVYEYIGIFPSRLSPNLRIIHTLLVEVHMVLC